MSSRTQRSTKKFPEAADSYSRTMIALPVTIVVFILYFHVLQLIFKGNERYQKLKEIIPAFRLGQKSPLFVFALKKIEAKDDLNGGFIDLSAAELLWGCVTCDQNGLNWSGRFHLVSHNPEVNLQMVSTLKNLKRLVSRVIPGLENSIDFASTTDAVTLSFSVSEETLDGITKLSIQGENI